jgi:DNA-binding phage protein
MLRDYVNATVTFEDLAKQMGKSSKSLQRMLGLRGNPTAESLFGIIKVLQEAEGVQLAVKTTKRAV